MLCWVSLLIMAPRIEKDRLIRIIRLNTALVSVVVILILVVEPRLPLGVGPERNGPRLADCLKAYSLPLVARRYQEMALLRAVPTDVAYRRAKDHRRSQYDLMSTYALDRGCDYL